MGRLSGKKVVMTAAGMGIGRACAIAMADEGATVYATDIDQPSLDSLCAVSVNLECVRLDVTDAAAIMALRNEVPTPDVLFNCAGYVHDGTLLEADDEAWNRSFQINVRSHARMIETFLPGMIENGGGSIINMATVASSLMGVASRCVYSATKGAVLGLTKSIAKDYVQQKIRCNAVCPGTVMTPSLKARMAARGNYDKAYEEMLDRQPTREMTHPEDIAPMVVYLASDESKVATGQFFIVDGGWSI
ncbi:SDR family oxidoreductase [Pelagibius sp. Alg239-R121]|uniref:SDR family oxidoreductase n=1 Tax=Pelagibius sp. Alg239-R121 TaxID=2993448 RepID=UPI0024A71392|nr:SDR family oxidoreductase [Pelagibius sp. Alg239-R121]